MLKMLVVDIVHNWNVVLLYGSFSDHNFHVIAPVSTEIQQGSIIEYGPGGSNFGWYTKTIGKVQQLIDKPKESAV